jgi:2,4-dienoyl-CoA reductase-like NADH-dependent reductase (Old Yellow Enzyme family)
MRFKLLGPGRRGWRLVTEAVHREAGRMGLPLWHVGRISDPIYRHGRLLALGAPLNDSDPKTFCVDLPDVGYTDIPTLTRI